MVIRRRGRQVGVVAIIPVTHVLRLEGRVARHEARSRGGGFVVAILAVKMTNCIFSVNFHVFSKRGRMGVGFVAASYFAVVRLITGVDV